MFSDGNEWTRVPPNTPINSANRVGTSQVTRSLIGQACCYLSVSNLNFESHSRNSVLKLRRHITVNNKC